MFFRLNTDFLELKRNETKITREVENLREISDKRKIEIEALHIDMKRLIKELAESNAAKCEALVRSEDLVAKEINIKHREARLEQDRDLFEERLNALSEDLRQAHDSSSLARREFQARIAQLEGDLSHRNESIRIFEGREEALLADKEVLQGRIDGKSAVYLLFGPAHSGKNFKI